jgi:general secretion pathway protein A
MYESFYKFKRAPFSSVPDPGLLFLSPQHQRALSLLEYAILARAGFCVVTGAVGAGKTTLVRRLLQKIERDLEIGLVSNTTCESFEELMQWILLAFNLEYRGKQKVELYDTFVAFLIEQYKKGRPVTLIVDEAQNLAPALLEQLRMLSNLNTEKGQLLQTILIGQPNLWDLLRRPELEQFAQRISYDYFLGPMESPDLTGQYIRHRLGAVGGDQGLFGEETYDMIWRATSGVPRLINLVCDTALVYGYAEQLGRIDCRIVEQVLKDKEMSFAVVGGAAQPSDEAAPSPNNEAKKPSRTRPPLVRSTIERAMLKLSDAK